jgi:hypothetical protein
VGRRRHAGARRRPGAAGGPALRALFVTYCLARPQGEVQIGAFKRCCRVALELHRRGHEALIHCTGHRDYRDPLTDRARAELRFVEIGFERADREAVERNRSRFRDALRRLRPDLVVIGEAPLAGPMLEATLTAAEVEVPVVVLDNVYHPDLVGFFCAGHGPALDGLVLNGPSALQAASAPPWVEQVPPDVEGSEDEARRWLADSGVDERAVVTAFAYDRHVLRLAASLAERLAGPDRGFVLLSRRPDECAPRLAWLSAAARRHVHVLAPPADPVLFGLLALSRLAIVKYGFMQLTECLSLRTPAVVVYRGSAPWFEHLPAECRGFVHVAPRPRADAATVAAALRFLGTDRAEIPRFHAGPLDAAARTAAFFERVAGRPPRATTAEVVGLGFGREAVAAALAPRHPGETVTVDRLRATRLRYLGEAEVYALLCVYRAGGERHAGRLWGWRFAGAAAARAFRTAAAAERREVLHRSPDGLVLLEHDLGDANLPPLPGQRGAAVRPPGAPR